MFLEIIMGGHQWNSLSLLTLFDMGGGGGDVMAPWNVFTTVLKRFTLRSWNFVTCNTNFCSINKSYFWFPSILSVTITTSFLRSTSDSLKSSFHMFPYNETLKLFKSKIWLDIWNLESKIHSNTKFQLNLSELQVSAFMPMGCQKYRLWREKTTTKII